MKRDKFLTAKVRRSQRFERKILFFAFLAHFAVQPVSALTVAPVFGDGMVLQREMAVPFWGYAEAGETVRVEYGKVFGQGVADENGKWRVTLTPMKANAVGTEIKVSGATDTVVFRDVLVGEVWVGSGQSNMAGRVVSYKGDDRYLADLWKGAPYTDVRLIRGGARPVWLMADAAAIDNFSAITFAFGMRLRRDLKVPIGLIVGAVGGTPSGQWLSEDAFEKNEACRVALEESSQKQGMADAFRHYEEKLAAWQAMEPKVGKEPAPPLEAGSMKNGGKIGGLYERHIRSFVGYGIRGVLWDQGESGTGIQGLTQFTVMGALIEGWHREWGQGNFPFLYVQKPSGGGCAYFPDQPLTERADEFVAKLPDIRKASDGSQRVESLRMMDYPNTWTVTVSDLGSGVHPPDKWAYGNRAAHVAEVAAYGVKSIPSGPRFRLRVVEGKRIRVFFDHVSKGLVAAHGVPLQGFAIAGADGRFVWAQAEIDRDSVVVWSDHVLNPSRVRYAYAGKRAWANLFNKDGLPALAFDE